MAYVTDDEWQYLNELISANEQDFYQEFSRYLGGRGDDLPSYDTVENTLSDYGRRSQQEGLNDVIRRIAGGSLSHYGVLAPFQNIIRRRWISEVDETGNHPDGFFPDIRNQEIIPYIEAYLLGTVWPIFYQNVVDESFLKDTMPAAQRQEEEPEQDHSVPAHQRDLWDNENRNSLYPIVEQVLESFLGSEASIEAIEDSDDFELPTGFVGYSTEDLASTAMFSDELDALDVVQSLFEPVAEEIQNNYNIFDISDIEQAFEDVVENLTGYDDRLRILGTVAEATVESGENFLVDKEQSLPTVKDFVADELIVYVQNSEEYSNGNYYDGESYFSRDQLEQLLNDYYHLKSISVEDEAFQENLAQHLNSDATQISDEIIETVDTLLSSAESNFMEYFERELNIGASGQWTGEIDSYGTTAAHTFLHSSSQIDDLGTDAHDGIMYFGIELELPANEGSAREVLSKVDSLSPVGGQSLAEAKSDSSLEGRGYELVFQPMDIGFAKEYPWSELFDFFMGEHQVETGDVDPGVFGGHIHVSLSSFTSELSVANFAYALTHWQLPSDLARDSDVEQDHYFAKDEDVRDRILAGRATGRGWVNVGPIEIGEEDEYVRGRSGNTLEWRGHRATLDADELLDSLEFLQELHDYIEDFTQEMIEEYGMDEAQSDEYVPDEDDFRAAVGR